MDAVTYRFTTADDIPQILLFIKELAEYEKLGHEVVATEELLHEWLFIKQKAEVLFAEVAGEPAGFALFFHNFSTFLGKAGLYLEDLFVRPQFRGRGIGKEFFRILARTAVERECGRLEWWCLDWNQESIDFYLALGAQPMDEWTVYRLSGEVLASLAGEG